MIVTVDVSFRKFDQSTEMRRGFSILLLLLYMAVLVRPLSPYLVFQANYDYIKAELCEQRDNKTSKCNGQCFLRKNLKEEAQDHSSNPQRNLAEEEFNIFQPEVNIQFYVPVAHPLLNEFPVNDNIKDQYFADLIAPPPQSAFNLA